jgi:hypothetical protein
LLLPGELWNWQDAGAGLSIVVVRVVEVMGLTAKPMRWMMFKGIEVFERPSHLFNGMVGAGRIRTIRGFIEVPTDLFDLIQSL